MQLYHFHSSSASFRARIALHLKGIAFDDVPVVMRFRGGDNDTEEFRAFNPQGSVPVLVDGDVKIAQTMAIVEYLDERYTDPALLPRDPAGRARVRSIALHIACEIQPINALRVERHLKDAMGLDDDGLRAWRHAWISRGFDAIERELASPATGLYCHGETPTAADCFLVPQVYNALRPGVRADIDRWPTIARIYTACLEHPAFERSLPKNQSGYFDVKEH